MSIGKPLAGVRVIESSMLGPAEMGGLLADLGADVVKVEPPGGDYGRRMTWPIIRSQDPVLAAVMSLAESRPSGVAMRVIGNTTSREIRYGELLAAVNARASVLSAAGLRPGDRAILILALPLVLPAWRVPAKATIRPRATRFDTRAWLPALGDFNLTYLGQTPQMVV